MNKERAKELLKAIHSCQESGCQEDCDAACAMLENDPELQAWFEEEMGGFSEFDDAVAAKMECCCAPESLRERCKSARPAGGGISRFMVPILAAAALFVVGFFVIGNPGGGDSSGDVALIPLTLKPSGGDLQAFRSDVTQLVRSGRLSLHHQGDELESLNTWLVSHQASGGTLAPTIAGKEGIGCAVLEWGAEKVSMICVRDGACGGCGIVHIFVVDRSIFAEPQLESLIAVHERRNGLDTGGWADDDHLYLLVGDKPDVKLDTLL